MVSTDDASPILNRSHHDYHGKPLSLEELEKTPHLKPMAEFIRNVLHANKILRDIDLQNKRDYAEFVSLCNNNLFFFLLVTRQHYLLQTLFYDAANHQLMHPFIEHYYQQTTLPHNNPILFKSADEKSLSKKDDINFNWSDPAANISLFAQVQHLESELLRITLLHHHERQTIHTQAVNYHIKHIEHLIERLSIDPNHNETVKELHTLNAHFNAQFELLLKIDTKYPDNKDNPDAIINQSLKLEKMHQDFANSIFSFVQKFGHTDDQINELGKQITEHHRITALKISEIDKRFAQQRVPLIHALNTSRQELISTLEKPIDKVLAALNTINLKTLTKSNQMLVLKEIKNLQDLKFSLNGANHSTEIKTTVERIQKSLLHMNQSLPASALEQIKIPLKQAVDEMDSVFPTYRTVNKTQEFKNSLNHMAHLGKKSNEPHSPIISTNNKTAHHLFKTFKSDLHTIREHNQTDPIQNGVLSLFFDIDKRIKQHDTSLLDKESVFNLQFEMDVIKKELVDEMAVLDKLKTLQDSLYEFSHTNPTCDLNQYIKQLDEIIIPFQSALPYH